MLKGSVYNENVQHNDTFRSMHYTLMSEERFRGGAITLFNRFCNMKSQLRDRLC